MDVSRETPDVTTKPKCYDLTNMLVPHSAVPSFGAPLGGQAWVQNSVNQWGLNVHCAFGISLKACLLRCLLHLMPVSNSTWCGLGIWASLCVSDVSRPLGDPSVAWGQVSWKTHPNVHIRHSHVYGLIMHQISCSICRTFYVIHLAVCIIPYVMYKMSRLCVVAIVGLCHTESCYGYDPGVI